MAVKSSLWLVAVAPLAIAQPAIKVLPVPGDPLELVTGPVQSIAAGTSRDMSLRLLARARDNFALKTGQGAYRLEVSFTADSQHVTNYDGAWKMDEMFDPERGLRWTAKSDSGYITTRIHSSQGAFAAGTANAIPLRLHEAHGLLSDPLESPEYASRGSIRTANVTFHGSPLVCLLLAHTQKPAVPPTGRAWEESEECIDPRSGLLQLHSEVPGRYVVYDYSQGPQIGSHILPRTVTVSEAGRVVSKISVDSIEELTAADAGQFAPSDAMKSSPPAITIKSAIRLSRVHRQRPSSSMTMRAVCVFGVVTPTGQLAEAHSLQPSDPDSGTAVEDAKSIDFTPFLTGGAPLVSGGPPPQQRFAFIVEKFITRQ